MIYAKKHLIMVSIISIAACLLFIIIYIIVNHTNSPFKVLASNKANNSPMQIHFINVGQGDCIFIDYQDVEVLIDSGDAEYGRNVSNYIQSYVDGDLDVVLETHVHSDHIGGLLKIFEEYQVDRIVYNGRKAIDPIGEKSIEAGFEEPNCISTLVDKKTVIEIGENAQLSIIPSGTNYDFDEENQNSLMTTLTYNKINVLLMADASGLVERDNLNEFSDIDVLKVGHHGSRTSTSQEFLDVVKPEVAIISAGRGNSMGLPNPYVLSRLIEMGTAVFGTFKVGSIVMNTDGETYNFNTRIELTVQDAGAGGRLSETQYIYYDMAADGTCIAEKTAACIGDDNSKKFHSMNCDAGTVIWDNKLVFFKSKQDAISAGYAPCERCN